MTNIIQFPGKPKPEELNPEQAKIWNIVEQTPLSIGPDLDVTIFRDIKIGIQIKDNYLEREYLGIEQLLGMRIFTLMADNIKLTQRINKLTKEKK